MNNQKEIAALKRHIRGRLNMAAARGQIDGTDALAILQSVAAEFVARVDHDELRQGLVTSVVETFPLYVERERSSTEGIARQ